MTAVLDSYRRFSPRLMALAVVVISLALFPGSGRAEEANTNALAIGTVDTNGQETLRTYLQLQEQLHMAQMAIEQNRKEAREAAAQNSDVLAGRLLAIEKALETQRSRELEAMQTSNHLMLLVAGTVAGTGFVAMLLMSFFQWRTVNRLAELSSLPSFSGPTRAALGPGDITLGQVGPAEQSSMRLLSAMEQLQKRIHELEHTTRTPLHDAHDTNGGSHPAGSSNTNGGSVVASNRAGSSSDSSQEANSASVLLGKGQSLLNLDDVQGAVGCFDEVLKIDPKNAEAWVRKGTALERLQRLDEAVECYDRALAADASLTIAYLHKGGLFNRMERFNEALECYEKALRTQEKRRG